MINKLASAGLCTLTFAALLQYSPLEVKTQEHLPITPETRRAIGSNNTEALKFQYCKELQTARKTFNESIADGKFSLTDQNLVHEAYQKLKETEARLSGRGVNPFALRPKDGSETFTFADESLTKALQRVQTERDYTILTALFNLERISEIVDIENPQRTTPKPHFPLKYGPGEAYPSREEKRLVLLKEQIRIQGKSQDKLKEFMDRHRYVTISTGVVSFLVLAGAVCYGLFYNQKLRASFRR